MTPPSPHELWQRAGGDSERYMALMREHGLIRDNPPCRACGETFRHRHDGERIVRLDIFGHDER